MKDLNYRDILEFLEATLKKAKEAKEAKGSALDRAKAGDRMRELLPLPRELTRLKKVIKEIMTLRKESDRQTRRIFKEIEETERKNEIKFRKDMDGIR